MESSVSIPVIRVLFLLARVPEFLVLENGAEHCTYAESCEVTVESTTSSLNLSALDHLDKLELVRESTRIHGDTSYEGI